MRKLFLFLFWIAAILICFAQQEPANPVAILAKYESADKLYQQAEKKAEEAGEDEDLLAKADRIYQQALAQFTPLIHEVELAGYDSLHFFIRLKKGSIEYLFDSVSAAHADYLAAINLKEKLPAVADSFLFLPLLYTGSIFYAQNQFDSSLSYYKKAEVINDAYTHPLNESQRLYNRLGVIYYETGNYRQARNYFEKAITVTPPGSLTLIANYKINIASLLVKLDELDTAKKIYKSLLPLHVFDNEINHNLGIISLKQSNYDEAINYLDKVNYTDKKNIDLYYNRAMAWAGKNHPDSVQQNLQRALAENQKWNGTQRNTAHGLILKFQADQLLKVRLYLDALSYYQRAMMQFAHDFSDPDLSRNPEQFNAVYSYINLFNTLTAKAGAFEEIYKQDKKIQTLVDALEAFRAAFQLADHVGKTYNSDEARLFLARIKYAVHSRPIEIGLELYRLTGKIEYLEEVYFFDQRNKASVLTMDIQEQELRSADKTTNELYHQESSLRSSITRLSMKAAAGPDSAQFAALNAEIRDDEIALNKIQEEIGADPSRQQWRAAEQIPAVNELQRKLDNTTAILSYHLSPEKLLILLIAANRFDFREVEIGKDFFTRISLLKNGLYNATPGQRYSGTGDAIYLYRQLIAPLAGELSQLKRLIIIPDDELHYLPFEALQDEHRNYLVQTFSVQYQFATSLLGDSRKTRPSKAVLSFAPFVSSGFTDSGGTRLESLPASGTEIKGTAGMMLLDSAATKKNFLESANHYGIIHLATHASVNNEDPMRSFIAFYPGVSDYKLYAQEIYDLRLDTARLVILSACETGSGQLIKGEGLMSLSRAFAYAGCPNIIASLWTAEDKTTAFIIRRLYYYLNKKVEKDRALQQAKLDLLNSNEIDARYKTPDYWAHLLLIGNYEPEHKETDWAWVALFIIAILLIYLFLKRKPAGTR